MDHVIGLQCSICSEIYQPGEVQYVCPKHGNDGNLNVIYNYDLVRAQWHSQKPNYGQGMWRYKALLPIELDASIPPLLVGNTPMYSSESLAQRIGVREIWIKDDTRN